MKLSADQQLAGMKKLRESMNIESKSISDQTGDITRVKCTEASYFPNPPSFWKESKLSIYGLIYDDFDDYIKIYEYNGIRVIVSVARYNNIEWLHVSFSRKSRIPDYKDIQLVRKSFIGEDKKSIMVFPEKEHYVNIAENCLHLWYSPNNPLPDFDVEIPGIGRSI